MEPIIIYGIPNCDTIKKTLNWFKLHKLPYRFHDYRKEGITTEQLKQWSALLGWETLLNTRGTTWRKLEPAVQSATNNATAAIRLMKEHNSLIRRPIIEQGKQLFAGFNEEELLAHFKKENKPTIK